MFLLNFLRTFLFFGETKLKKNRNRINTNVMKIIWAFDWGFGMSCVFWNFWCGTCERTGIFMKIFFWRAKILNLIFNS